MGPIGSKVIKVKGQIYVSSVGHVMSYLRLCVFVCMCVSYLSSSPQSSYC